MISKHALALSLAIVPLVALYAQAQDSVKGADNITRQVPANTYGPPDQAEIIVIEVIRLRVPFHGADRSSRDALIRRFPDDRVCSTAESCPGRRELLRF
jgi:hypothetical protein